MSSPQKPTAAESWAALVAMRKDDAAAREIDRDAEQETERILALNSDELHQELVDVGIDPAELRARADQLAERAARQVGVVLPPRRRGPSARTVVLLLAAAFALLLVVRWRGARWIHPDTHVIGPDTPSPDENALARARDLRRAARGECASARWQACLEQLNEARGLDPAGEARDPTVLEERRAADEAVAGGPKSPPNGPKR